MLADVGVGLVINIMKFYQSKITTFRLFTNYRYSTRRLSSVSAYAARCIYPYNMYLVSWYIKTPYTHTHTHTQWTYGANKLENYAPSRVPVYVTFLVTRDLAYEESCSKRQMYPNVYRQLSL